ncbi:MAG: spermidine synthase [Vicinamibacterales bacterium]
MTATYAGLALTMLATLLTEIVVSRLLSVITWYHLSFVAISVAMLGAAAGGVVVFAAPERFRPEQTARDLAVWSARFALVLPLSHLLSLVIPLPGGQQWTTMDVVVLAVGLAVIATPFALGGVVTTLALTRTPAPIGRLYAADLLGAALGSVAAVVLLDATNLSTAALTASACAAVGALAFRRAAGLRSGVLVPALLAVVVAAAVGNAGTEAIRVLYPKNRAAWSLPVLRSLWNSHAHVLAFAPTRGPRFFWGGGDSSEGFVATQSMIVIDGEAGTPMAEWDGDPASLDWAGYDVTALPYALRRDGTVAVVGVGGGRDILTAIYGGSRAVTGVELNGNIVRLLTEYHRRFTRLADHPGVRLVHDEGRAFLTRTPDRYDVLQMSLVDTWAATGAGAFTLSENGLYTREAWRIFLDRLTPTGVLSVSRWFSPSRVSETSRLMALAVQALLDRGVRDPVPHLLLVARGTVATLLVSPSPFSAADLATLEATCRAFEFTVLASPAVPPADPRLAAIVRSRSEVELAAAVADPAYDYSPPTDARPFFFNMVRLGAWWGTDADSDGGVIAGNLRATGTLVAILGVAAAFVVAAVVVPLAARVRPAMPPPALAAGLTYFAGIGTAFMLAQVAFLQRFSVLLGHPTYALVVVLFAMILFTGVGSLWSDRLLGRQGGRFALCALALAAGLAVTAATIAGIAAVAVAWSLPARVMVVLAVVAPLSVLLGVCFPHGARLVQQRDPAALAWMWGANGGAGVLASIVAVIVSMSAGIEWNLLAAAVIYAALPLLARGIGAPREVPGGADVRPAGQVLATSSGGV